MYGSNPRSRYLRVLEDAADEKLCSLPNRLQRALDLDNADEIIYRPFHASNRDINK